MRAIPNSVFSPFPIKNDIYFQCLIRILNFRQDKIKKKYTTI